MRVDIEPLPDKPGFFKVTPHGPIDSDTHDGFRERVEPLLTKAIKGIVLDLRNVDYISSSGLGVLFLIKKKLAENKGWLLFCEVKPQIEKLFEVVKTLPTETLFSSFEEADKYFYEIMNREIKRLQGGR